MTRRSLAALSAGLAALLAHPALAQEAPISTAQASAAAPDGDVADQIAAYLASSPAASLPQDETPGVVSSAEAPREIHGAVSVSVGSHGYRSVYARSDIPIGKTGTLSVAVQDSRGGRSYGPGPGRSLGVGLAFGEAAAGRGDGRCGDPAFAGRRRLDMADEGFICRPARSAEPLL